MFNSLAVQDFLHSKGFNLFSDIRYREIDDTILVYVESSLVSETIQKQKISKQQIKKMRANIAERFERSCEFILLEDDSRALLEKLIFSEVSEAFDDVEALSISVSAGVAINATISISNDDSRVQTAISEFFASYLEKSDFHLGNIMWTSSIAEPPGNIQLLRVLKIHQPISTKELLDKFKNNPSVNEKWMKRTLDKLRKSGFVQWQKDVKNNETYVLTGKGLMSVPAGKNRNSSDVERALALAKRKW